MALGVKTGGRQKGTPNKIHAELKDMILQAFEKVGGVDYLAEQALVSPTAFLTLLGKVLPMTISGTAEDGSITLRWVKPDAELAEQKGE